MDLPQNDQEELLPLFQEHLPNTLSMAFDKAVDKVPEQYIINAIACRLASKMVYKGKQTNGKYHYSTRF